MRTRTRRRPRRWILGAFLVLLVAAGAIGFFSTRGTPHDQVASVPGGTPSTTVPIIAADPAPTGCLGGPSRDAAMVSAAQALAGHSSNGAVEFATAFVRWTFQFPAPSVDDARFLSEHVISDTAPPGFRDLAGSMKATPNSSAGAVKDGTSFYFSTVPGVWYLESAASDEVTVSIGSAYVVDGALSPSLRAVSTFTLSWSAGGWHIQSGEMKRTTEEIFAIGTPFTGGC